MVAKKFASTEYQTAMFHAFQPLLAKENPALNDIEDIEGVPSSLLAQLIGKETDPQHIAKTLIYPRFVKAAETVADLTGLEITATLPYTPLKQSTHTIDAAETPLSALLGLLAEGTRRYNPTPKEREAGASSLPPTGRLVSVNNDEYYENLLSERTWVQDSTKEAMQPLYEAFKKKNSVNWNSWETPKTNYMKMSQDLNKVIQELALAPRLIYRVNKNPAKESHLDYYSKRVGIIVRGLQKFDQLTS
jgi:hypothetical protein